MAQQPEQAGKTGKVSIYRIRVRPWGKPDPVVVDATIKDLTLSPAAMKKAGPLTLVLILFGSGCAAEPKCLGARLEDDALQRIASERIVAEGGQYRPYDPDFDIRISRDKCDYLILVTTNKAPRPGDAVLVRIDQNGNVLKVIQGL